MKISRVGAFIKTKNAYDISFKLAKENFNQIEVFEPFYSKTPKYLNQKNFEGKSPIILVLQHGRLEMFEQLIENYKD
jgi:ankyrin repeat protein